LLDKRWIGIDNDWMAVSMKNESNARLFSLRHEEVADFPDSITQVTVPAIKLHATRVAQEVSEDVAEACSFARERVNATRHAGTV